MKLVQLKVNSRKGIRCSSIPRSGFRQLEAKVETFSFYLYKTGRVTIEALLLQNGEICVTSPPVSVS